MEAEVGTSLDASIGTGRGRADSIAISPASGTGGGERASVGGVGGGVRRAESSVVLAVARSSERAAMASSKAVWVMRLLLPWPESLWPPPESPWQDSSPLSGST